MTAQQPRRSPLPSAVVWLLAVLVILAITLLLLLLTEPESTTGVSSESIGTTTPPPADSSVPSAAATTRPEPTSATRGPDPTPTTPPGPCPGVEPAPVRPDPSLWRSVLVDMDGDGHDDEFIVYRHDPGEFSFRVEFANGYAAEHSPAWGWAFDVVGAMDVGRTGQLAVTKLGQGPDVGLETIGFFYFEECWLRPVMSTVAAVEKSEFFGETPSSRNGIHCTGDGYDHLFARRTEGEAFDWVVESTSYVWDEGRRGFDHGLTASIALCCNRPEQDDFIYFPLFDCPG